ncbi:MAG TPA: GMC family oxidoreductase [Gemmatimonadaceae bacterium]|nr:GMC family oxidoreductase [Gemmatimonadaceae bacterium]
MTRQQAGTEFDVCIVGSGAGGGTAAYALTQAGVNVVMLEAGGWWDNTKDSKMFAWNYSTPRRGSATKERPFGEFDACIGGWDIDGEPYTKAEGTRFDWWRARMLGGRTNHWGRISLRFGPDDFKSKSKDGLGDDWPISYDDIAPYYDKVDDLVGVYGSNEGLRNHPDGHFLPAPEPRCREHLVKKASARLNVTCIPARLSILTRPINGRKACHYCGQCNRGCTANANYTSPNVMLFPAQKTGKLDIITNAMAREVNVGSDGRATGVTYVDKTTGTEKAVRARVVVLAASACESARLLLNSKSSRFPQGLANSSGMVGKYLTDTVGNGVGGFIPALVDQPRHNCDGVGGMHVYMPWWLDNRKLDFPRGYHIEVWGGMGMPGNGTGGGMHRLPPGGGYGASFKNDVRRYYGTTIGFDGRGEMIPNEKSYCELDPEKKDRWGIPVLRFHWEWTDYEINQAKHMQETFRALIVEMGGTPNGQMPGKERGYGISNGGSIIHEAGGARMGDNASTSVLNAKCQAHDCKNLFIADGAPFVGQADKNPTWTIMALAWRTGDTISDMLKRREL